MVHVNSALAQVSGALIWLHVYKQLQLLFLIKSILSLDQSDRCLVAQTLLQALVRWTISRFKLSIRGHRALLMGQLLYLMRVSSLIHEGLAFRCEEGPCLLSRKVLHLELRGVGFEAYPSDDLRHLDQQD